MVDFPQALTALDYLKDLETRRRKEVAASLNRLGIDRNSLGFEVDELARRYPGVAAWVRALEEKEKRVDAYYTGLWVALRRWVSETRPFRPHKILTILQVLINEMSLVPFNKHNCHAMLNTLYPPVASAQPTSRLTPAMLTNQRDGFFKYIKAVEQRGPGVLGNLIKQNKQPGDETGWPEVARTLEKYLRLANSIITESQEVNSVDYFGDVGETEKRKGKKTDSGVSFSSASSTRPSTGDSLTESKKSTPPTPNKGGSTLERIAREFKKMRSKSKFDVQEIVKLDRSKTRLCEPDNLHPMGSAVSTKEAKPKIVRKMRSLGALGDIRNRNNSSATVHDMPKASLPPTFDKDEMRRQRMAYEANSSRMKWARSHEV